ncbi:FtsB family cell division protein [Caenibacillus caldisaponilyticus]|uniref:FtsB family cell division protein n=1 Tax=Caenibacillus caldisaponilyticus TaxID=1674942 RepID=UPI001300E422|nr:septum formation initiator family protein [Caenibacillus caldisaponilyticus]
MRTAKDRVTQLHSDYVASREVYEKWRRKRRKGLIRRLVAFFVLFGLVTAAMVNVLQSQYARLHEMNDQKAEVEKRLSDVKDEQKALRREIQLLHNDDYLGKLIRRDYYMSKNGEIIFASPGSDQH